MSQPGARLVGWSTPTAVFVALGLVLGACGASDPGREATRPLPLPSPSDTPPLDRSQATVSLADVVFDTFDGSFVPLDEASDDRIVGLRDAIRPLDAPEYESASAADDWLDPDELVLGYVDPEGNAWSFPLRILDRHEIVNDEFGGQPVVVTYCPLCGSGVVFDPRLDGSRLAFSNTSALYENDLVMVDRTTGSFWWQTTGRAIVGPMSGTQLELLSSETTTWASWRQRHPDTSSVERLEARDYSRDIFADYGDRLDAGSTPFPVSPRAFEDDRLAPSARVVVVTIDGVSKAWPTDPARTVTDELAGRTLTVTVDGVGGVVRDESGEPLPNLTAFWFAVAAAFPDIAIG